MFFHKSVASCPKQRWWRKLSDTGVQTWPSERFLFRVDRASHCYGNMYIFNRSSKNPAKFKTTTCRCWMLLYGELAGFVVVSSCNCAENLKRERRGFAASHSPRLSSPCGGGESDSNPGKVPRPTEVWRRPRRWAVCWRGPLLSARSAFVSSIEEAGGLR